MNELRKFVIMVFGLVVSVAITVLVMIKGWGLEPQSWVWIIGVGIGGQIFAQCIIALATTKD